MLIRDWIYDRRMTSQVRKVTINYKDKSQRFFVRDLADWAQVANGLAGLIKPGSIITLQGPLGAGKTTLVQHLAKMLGAPKRAISPTFALMRIYALPSKPARKVKRLLHVDAYRLDEEKDLIVLDLDEELAASDTAIVIEWPEQIKKWLKGKKYISLKIDF
jgi:tRNA threonylcarbamoyladenosine biosynthesis protein TsaE